MITLKKYLFGLIVISYVITVIGIPVYLHYCGGELEEISYLMKGNDCCGDEEPMDNGCCEDQDRMIQSNPAFTYKGPDALKNLAPINLSFFPPLTFIAVKSFPVQAFISKVFNPPPKLQEQIVLVSVLRI